MDVKTSQPQKGDMGLGQQMQGYSQATVPPGTHPSLAYMAQLDQVVIKQQIELLEVLTSCETRNKFQILNNQGQQVYFAREESGFCMRQCCGPNRGFVMHITDMNEQEIITATREFKCCAGCCWCASADCCSFELRVESPPGTVVGYCRQQQSKWKAHLEILDADRNHVFTIWGPCCPCTCICCPKDIEFPVLDKHEKQQVCMISKQWSGAIREMLTDADTFGVTFPRDLNLPMKATLLGTVFLVDFMLFEHQQNN